MVDQRHTYITIALISTNGGEKQTLPIGSSVQTSSRLCGGALQLESNLPSYRPRSRAWTGFAVEA